MSASILSGPRCCGAAMRDVTESDERALGILAWICDRCKHECQTLPQYLDAAQPTTLPMPERVSHAKHSRDPRLYGIRRKARRYEVRIAAGRHGPRGYWIYICMAGSIAEAIQARDRARQQQRGAAA